MTDWTRLQALVDEGNIDALLREVTRQDVADTWMRYQRRNRVRESTDDDPDWWAVEVWMSLEWWRDESRVRDGIIRLVELADDDRDFGIIGAAIHEVFVCDDESRLRWIEREAASSKAFRRSLANVYVWGVESEEVATRVEAAARSRLPRPRNWPGP